MRTTDIIINSVLVLNKMRSEFSETSETKFLGGQSTFQETQKGFQFDCFKEKCELKIQLPLWTFRHLLDETSKCKSM